MDAVAEVIDLAQPATPELHAVPEPVSEPKKAVKAFETLEAVLAAINEQDEQLKVMKAQIQDMLATNTALKRGIKTIVQNAEKNDALEQELQQARKKLAALKTFING